MSRRISRRRCPWCPGRRVLHRHLPESARHTDTNNVAPRRRLRLARAARATIVRGGYGINYNAGTYSAIARQLAHSRPLPPRARASARRRAGILSESVRDASPADDENNFGVDKDYVLGRCRRGTAMSRSDIRQVWNISASYTRYARRETSTSSARRIAARPGFGSRASSRSCGRRRRVVGAARRPPSARRGARSKASAAASPTRLPSRATTRRPSAAAAPPSPRTIRTSTPSGGSRASTGGISSPRT